MNLKYFTRIGLAMLLAGSVTGCKKMDLAPTDRFSELTFWQSDENVNNALNDVYGRMYSSQLFFYNEALSDNAFTRLGISAGFPDAITSGNFTSTLARFSNEWSYYYSAIKVENMFLENVDKNTTLAPAVRDRMKAEARFIRAFHYFKLANWWGDVPLLKTDVSPEESKTVARTPKAEVMQFVVSELEDAAKALPTKDQYAAADRGRITKGAAKALEARVLLYNAYKEDGSVDQEKMKSVVALCEDLMNNQAANGSYSLVSKYDDVFSPSNEYNSEVMLDLQYVPNLRTWNEHYDFVPISVGARTNNLAPTQELVNSYVMLNGKRIDEAGSGYDENNPYVGRDPRMTSTIVYHGYNWKNADGTTQTIYIKPGTDPNSAKKNEYNPSGQGTMTGYYWRKYYDPTSTGSFNSGLNLILIRYAEVLLMYAEAKNALGQMDASVWDKTIRPIRARAGFTDPGALTFPTNGNLTDIIRNERRSEFVLEGLRVDDIRRWRIANQVLNGWAHGAKYGDPSIDNGYIRAQLRKFEPNKHYLWPIPAAELAKDANLTQNPNY